MAEGNQGLTMQPTETLTMKVMNGEEEISNVTWAVDSAELTVSGSGEAILDGTMTKTMQAYTVTASQDGNTVAKAIVCVYSPNHHTHKYDYSPDGSSVYNVFIHLDSVGEESGYCVVHDGEIVGRMSGSNTDEDIARAIKDGTIFDFRERTACP